MKTDLLHLAFKVLLFFIVFFPIYIIIFFSFHELGHFFTCKAIPNAYVTELDILRIKFINDNITDDDYLTYETGGFVRCHNITHNNSRAILKMNGFLTTQIITLFIGYPLLYIGKFYSFLFIYTDFIGYCFTGEFIEGLQLLELSTINITIISILIFITNSIAFITSYKSFLKKNIK